MFGLDSQKGSVYVLALSHPVPHPALTQLRVVISLNLLLSCSLNAPENASLVFRRLLLADNTRSAQTRVFASVDVGQ